MQLKAGFRAMRGRSKTPDAKLSHCLPIERRSGAGCYFRLKRKCELRSAGGVSVRQRPNWRKGRAKAPALPHGLVKILERQRVKRGIEQRCGQTVMPQPGLQRVQDVRFCRQRQSDGQIVFFVGSDEFWQADGMQKTACNA